MTKNDSNKSPPAESNGIDEDYEKERPRALKELEAQMAGPRNPGKPEADVKNPDGEFENPAPFTNAIRSTKLVAPNGTGNSDGNGDIDPQGQQAGTNGGQPATPKLPNEIHPVASKTERASKA